MKIWTEQSQKFTLSFLQFLKLLKKVIREKLQPPLKISSPLEPVTPPPHPKTLIFPTPPPLFGNFPKSLKPSPSPPPPPKWRLCLRALILCLKYASQLGLRFFFTNLVLKILISMFGRSQYLGAHTDSTFLKYIWLRQWRHFYLHLRNW